jgi:uncharacterized protein YdaU (DUF1376 family)
MSEAPYVQFYTSDFLAGTSGMTAATKGVYITLLCLMYEEETPLPQSWDTLARRCGCTLPTFRKAIESLQDDGKIVVTDAGLWSPKCDKHIALRRERQNSATAAAKKRWSKYKQKQCAADATASFTQCQPDPEPEVREEGEAKASPKKQPRKAVPLEDWTPTAEQVAYALSLGLSEHDAYDQASRFIDWHRAERKPRDPSGNFGAAWRNWCRTAADRARRGNRGPVGQGGGNGGGIVGAAIRSELDRRAGLSGGGRRQGDDAGDGGFGFLRVIGGAGCGIGGA